MIEMIKKIFNLFFAYKSECNEGKNPFKSRTIWVNTFALIAVVLAKYADIHLSSEDIGVFLSVVNIILRLVSKSPVGFYEEKNG